MRTYNLSNRFPSLTMEDFYEYLLDCQEENEYNRHLNQSDPYLPLREILKKHLVQTLLFTDEIDEQINELKRRATQ
jgi:hypothetical protein